MSSSRTVVQPRPARARPRLPPCFRIVLHLLCNQPLVTLRDTSPENLGNQGHTGRKPPSQPSNPAGHLAADWARSAGQRRGTTQPQNPQPGLGELQGTRSLAPGTSLDSHSSPQKAQPSHGVGLGVRSQSRRKAQKENPANIHQESLESQSATDSCNAHSSPQHKLTPSLPYR